MFNFVFDKKSLVLLLSGLTVAGGLLFFAGLLVGVNLGLPGLRQGVAYAPRAVPVPAQPAKIVQPAVPCPDPVLPAEKPAPEPEPEPVQAPPQIAQILEEEMPPAPAPAPVEKPERPRPAQTVQASLRSEISGAFSVQVGAFSQKENSDAVMRELESRGYQPYVVVLPGRRARLHTVRIGRFADRQEAQQAAAELRRRANMTGIVQRIGRQL